MTANKYINLDSHVLLFNEWNDDSEKLVIFHNVSEALKIVQRSRLYSII